MAGVVQSPARKRRVKGQGEDSDDSGEFREFIIIPDELQDEGELTSPLPQNEVTTPLSQSPLPEDLKSPHTPPGYDDVWRQCLDLIGPETLALAPSTSELKSDEDSGSEMDTVSEDEESVLITEIAGHQLAWPNSNMAQPFVMFKIDSKLLFRGRMIKKRTALHRYSDFEHLKSAVKTEYERRHSHLVANLPSLPGKRFMVDHTSTDFIYERRAGLNEYLHKLSQMPHVQKSVAMLQFLRLDI